MVAVLAGCGSASHAIMPALLKISRPAMPVWCPRSALGATGTFDVRSVLGMPESDAAMSIARHGCKSRVVTSDGRHFAVTADFVRNRVDLTIEHDIVTAIRTS